MRAGHDVVRPEHQRHTRALDDAAEERLRPGAWQTTRSNGARVQDRASARRAARGRAADGSRERARADERGAPAAASSSRSRPSKHSANSCVASRRARAARAQSSRAASRSRRKGCRCRRGERASRGGHGLLVDRQQIARQPRAIETALGRRAGRRAPGAPQRARRVRASICARQLVGVARRVRQRVDARR